MAAVPAPARRETARAALLALFSSNPEMVKVCLDKSYDQDRTVATTYFQVS